VQKHLAQGIQLRSSSEESETYHALGTGDRDLVNST
jgi:hypothetical protein